MYKVGERERESVCVCVYVFVWYKRVVILIQYSLGIANPITNLRTYELMNFYYTELLRVLGLSICIGSSRRDREGEREVEIPKVGRDRKNTNLLVFARSIQYLYLPTYLTYVSYLVRYITFRNATQM